MRRVKGLWLWLCIAFVFMSGLGLVPAVAQPQPDSYDKFALWTNGTQLRGANVFQRNVYPELDGFEFMGDGAFGPPYSQDDFNRLAEMGANYVNLSMAGVYTIDPPYQLDPAAVNILDRFVQMAANADLFAVISFRTGPGRSDFTFYRDGAGDWYPADYLVESLWGDAAAQDAWVEMWRFTAERYRGNRVVVGYDLMVEPNSAGVLTELYTPTAFDAQYHGTTYDWNQFAPRLVNAIRQMDTDTPILIGGNSWSAATWLNHTVRVDDARVVYTLHQYEPFVYTHQEPNAPLAYGDTFDTNYDGHPDTFNRVWISTYLRQTAGRFMVDTGLPVAVNEFGVQRWAAGVDRFLEDEMSIFESLGVNYAIWAFYPSWEPYVRETDAFDFQRGSDPNNHNIVDNPLWSVLRKHWSRNTVFPSTVE